MATAMEKNVAHLVVDTTAFIQNAPLQNVGEHIVTCQEVVDEITSQRQLRRLVVLPYDLVVKNVDPENVRIIKEFAKKTGDYPSLSATDIKVMALTYQLEKEHVGTEHLRKQPIMQRTVSIATTNHQPDNANVDIAGFYVPNEHNKETDSKPKTLEETLNAAQKLQDLLEEHYANLGRSESEEENVDDVLVTAAAGSSSEESTDSSDENESDDDDDDEAGWITPSNVQKAKKQIGSELMDEKHVKVACMTTDFAMQNVLKQMNLSVAALDGRLIKQLRTFILRCYTCFRTTSIMTKLFCPKCGNKTLKRVAVSVDENGKQQIHINARRPLTGRGKKFSLPRIRGGKHSNNPHLVEDQPMPHQRPTRLAKTKNNPLDDDYIAGYSPFVMRDVTSKSAQMKIRPTTEVKQWMQKNPNESRRRRK